MGGGPIFSSEAVALFAPPSHLSYTSAPTHFVQMAFLASLSATAFQLPKVISTQAQKLAAPALAAAVTFHTEAAHAKSVLGVNGALDFGPLAGDQPGGEGTGKVRVLSLRPAPQPARPSAASQSRVRRPGAHWQSRGSHQQALRREEKSRTAIISPLLRIQAWRARDGRRRAKRVLDGEAQRNAAAGRPIPKAARRLDAPRHKQQRPDEK